MDNNLTRTDGIMVASVERAENFTYIERIECKTNKIAVSSIDISEKEGRKKYGKAEWFTSLDLKEGSYSVEDMYISYGRNYLHTRAVIEGVVDKDLYFTLELPEVLELPEGLLELHKFIYKDDPTIIGYNVSWFAWI